MSPAQVHTTQIKNLDHNENYKNLTNYIYIVSDKFVNFDKQLQDILFSMKET